MIKYYLTRYTDRTEYNKVWFRGVDFGPLEIIQENYRCIVLKNKGHKYWSSIGNQSYANAEYLVFLFTGDKEVYNNDIYESRECEEIARWFSTSDFA